MKKLLFSSVLALAGLGLCAAPSQAWTFGLIPYHCWPCGGCSGCGKCCGMICIRPYNAFSPVASGSMCFDGCNPFCGGGCPGGYPGMCPGGCRGPGPGGYAGGYPGDYAGGPADMSLPDSEGYTVTADPTVPSAPAGPALAQPPAAPTPVAAPGTGAYVMPRGGPIQPAGAYGYAPMLPPSVMPYGAQPYYGGYGR
jgi:hypothetical protein